MKKQLQQTLCVLTGMFALGASNINAADKDIVDTALAAGDFKILAKALEITGIDKDLKGKGPFTVFAPSDKAFLKLPKEKLHYLLKPENKDQLAQVLKYHVVAKKVDGATAVTLKQAPTLNGQKLRVQFKDAALFINSSRVISTDIVASNGVIHVVDSVLMPRLVIKPKPAPAKPTKPGKPMHASKDAASAKIIAEALELGKELFNGGNEKACAKVYKFAVIAVLEIKPKSLDRELATKVKNTLAAINSSKDQRANAWSLRRAMLAMQEKLAK
ncbi:MAG: fasciclin domain-containing protein [Akkermansiaceae bacterium]